MKYSIADKNSDLESLARLFADNLSPQYISHSELQGHRALRPGIWTKNIKSVLLDEIRARLKQPLQAVPRTGEWQGVIEAYEGKRLIGVALITVSHKSAVPFGVIEDIVIDGETRGCGYGEAMMDWITMEIQRAGVTRLFLESGIENQRAHHLFERLGFKPVSVVMMRELTGE